jgi:hypothetical protein
VSNYYQTFGSWNRLCYSLNSAMTSCCGCGSDGSYLPPSSLLNDFPIGLTSCAQALQGVIEELRRRLGARSASVQVSNATAFIVRLQLSSTRSDSAEIQIQTSSNCTYPLAVRWSRAKRFSTGLSSLGSKAAFLDYFTQQLGR